MSHPQLVLVWNQGRALENRTETSTGRLAAWFNSNAGTLSLLLAAVAVSFFFGGWYMKSDLDSRLQIMKSDLDSRLQSLDGFLKQKLTEADSTLKEIRNDVGNVKDEANRLKTGVALIEQRISSLEQETYSTYKEKAVAFGIQDPRVETVLLSQASPSQRVHIEQQDFYSLDLNIARVTQEHITFRFDGNFSGITFNNGHLTIPLKVGSQYNFVRLMRGDQSFDLVLTIVDLPTKDTAIVAV